MFFSPSSFCLPSSASPSSAPMLIPQSFPGSMGCLFPPWCKVNLKEGYCWHGWTLQTVLWWYKLFWFVCCASPPLISLFISIPPSLNSCSSPLQQPERLEVINRKGGKTDSHTAVPICSKSNHDMGSSSLRKEQCQLPKVWAVTLRPHVTPSSLPFFFFQQKTISPLLLVLFVCFCCCLAAAVAVVIFFFHLWFQLSIKCCTHSLYTLLSTCFQTDTGCFWLLLLFWSLLRHWAQLLTRSNS